MSDKSTTTCECGEKSAPGGASLCRVLSVEEAGPGYVRVALMPDRAKDARPGQFAMVRAGEGTDPLLRRPFSIHRLDRATGRFEFLIRVAGKGTRLLAGVRLGDLLDVLVPLGRGFGPAGEVPLLVGGGIGVAPLLFLAEELLREGKRPKLLLGGRTERDLLCRGEFSCLAVPSAYATEDGSHGETGLVTKLLGRELEMAGEAGIGKITVHACGPVPMLAAVSRMAESYGAACEVSMEAHMACGLGACLGCIIKGRGGENLRVCREGPVFPSTLVRWE